MYCYCFLSQWAAGHIILSNYNGLCCCCLCLPLTASLHSRLLPGGGYINCTGSLFCTKHQQFVRSVMLIKNKNLNFTAPPVETIKPWIFIGLCGFEVSCTEQTFLPVLGSRWESNESEREKVKSIMCGRHIVGKIKKSMRQKEAG